MYVEIREISAQQPVLLEMLKFETCKMVHMLNQAGATLGDNCVKIWIKQYSDEIFYPKIEFDFGRQELQYDMTVDGDIREVHYKMFDGKAGQSRRKDVPRSRLAPELIAVDEIIRKGYNFPYLSKET